MLRFVPRSLQLGPDTTVLGNDDDRIRCEERCDRDALCFFVARRNRSVDGKNQSELGVSRRALADEVEVAKLGYLISPELDPDRLGRTLRR